MLIGVDYHPSFQTIAFFVEETGEYDERELNHGDGEAERFYRDLHQRRIRVRLGMEATGYSRWFERLLAELGFELWIGDPAEIKAKRVKKQKYDREDARLLLRLMRGLALCLLAVLCTTSNQPPKRETKSSLYSSDLATKPSGSRSWPRRAATG